MAFFERLAIILIFLGTLVTTTSRAQSMLKTLETLEKEL
jgi:hypothetical protein